MVRGRFEEDLASNTTGGLMMDSRGVSDAMTRNLYTTSRSLPARSCIRPLSKRSLPSG